MKKIIIALALILTSCTSTAPRMAQVELGSSDFSGRMDSEAHPAAGVSIVYGLGDSVSPNVASDLGLQVTGGESTINGVELETKRAELTTGLRYFLSQGRLRPYLGAGLSLLYVDAQGPGGGQDTASDWSGGAYARLGVDYALSDELRLGVDFRALRGASADLGDERLDFDQDVLCLTLSWGF